MRRPGPAPYRGYDGPDRLSPSAGDRRARDRALVMGAHPCELVEMNQLVYVADGRCWICRHPVLGDWSMDHVIPLAKGGDHTYNNVRLTHARCNSDKGARLPDELFSVPSVFDLFGPSPIVTDLSIP
jgi:5-methylcytosine-specific restriction endonuclease McrA